MAVVEDGRFDVIFFPYNFQNPDIGEKIIEACKEKNIGTMIIKSNPIVAFESYEDIIRTGNELDRTTQKEYDDLKNQMNNAASFIKKYGLEDIERIKEASILYILNNKKVGTICCRFPTYSDIIKHVSLSGTRLEERNSIMLADCKL